MRWVWAMAEVVYVGTERVEILRRRVAGSAFGELHIVMSLQLPYSDEVALGYERQYITPRQVSPGPSSNPEHDCYSHLALTLLQRTVFPSIPFHYPQVQKQYAPTTTKIKKNPWPLPVARRQPEPRLYHKPSPSSLPRRGIGEGRKEMLSSSPVKGFITKFQYRNTHPLSQPAGYDEEPNGRVNAYKCKRNTKHACYPEPRSVILGDSASTIFWREGHGGFHQNASVFRRMTAWKWAYEIGTGQIAEWLIRQGFIIDHPRHAPFLFS